VFRQEGVRIEKMRWSRYLKGRVTVYLGTAVTTSPPLRSLNTTEEQDQEGFMDGSLHWLATGTYHLKSKALPCLRDSFARDIRKGSIPIGLGISKLQILLGGG